MKKVIQSLDEIPQGMTEAEEHEYWKMHAMGEGIEFYPVPEDDSDLPPPREKTIPASVQLRFDDDTRARLRALADKKGVMVRRLLTLLVLEGLRAEVAQERARP
jgi:hypothetical protein